MHTRSNMKVLEEQVQSLQQLIDSWDQTLDQNLDEKLEQKLVRLDKLDDDIKDFNYKLDTPINQGRPTEEPLKEWHSEPQQEENYDSGLFGHYPPPFYS